MRRLTTILTIALTVPALPGCVEDKPAPRLESPDRSERIEAVRHAQSQYGPSTAPATPAAAAGKEAAGGDDTKLPPIDGRWIFKATLYGQSQETPVTITGGELRLPDGPIRWKNIRPVTNSATRYSAVRVAPGMLWGTREDPVELYLDADGILHYDDSNLPSWLRCYGIMTLRRP